MIAGRNSVLAVIPARGGSKGLPRKNVLPLGGRPLIAWTVEAALAATCIDRVIVSTDDPEIADVARAAGADVPFIRPDEIATDTASSADVLAHALATLPDFDAAALLQPTSPFRTAADLDAAYALWEAQGSECCVSVTAAEESPWLMFGRDASGGLRRLLPPPPGGLRRQDLPSAYVLNGAIYFVRSQYFMRNREFLGRRTTGYVMPIDRSVDIDTAKDLAMAQAKLDAWGGSLAGAK